jgi:hypothetical protein
MDYAWKILDSALPKHWGVTIIVVTLPTHPIILPPDGARYSPNIYTRNVKKTIKFLLYTIQHVTVNHIIRKERLFTIEGTELTYSSLLNKSPITTTPW